jgi:phosphatidylethanolamine/phosphatidyl-N-methylethanolamine N-methyltransferase
VDDSIDVPETAKTLARYNRIAPMYDAIEVFAERHFAPLRRGLWSRMRGGQILEVGVGTGKNFAYHPSGAVVTGIDLSDRMLEQASRRALDLAHPVELEQMDVQQLAIGDAAFDAAVATFVFCSVPDPVRGLRELGRVVKPGGQIVLVEHVRIDSLGIVGKLMDLLDPLVVRVVGAHINRRTVENVRRAGLHVEQLESLAPLGLVKLIVASPANGQRITPTED